MGFFFFLKLPRCFRGAAEGGNYCFIVSFGEPHIIKQYCFSVCLIIKVITCLLFKKKKIKGPRLCQDNHFFKPDVFLPD